MNNEFSRSCSPNTLSHKFIHNIYVSYLMCVCACVRMFIGLSIVCVLTHYKAPTIACTPANLITKFQNSPSKMSTTKNGKIITKAVINHKLSSSDSSDAETLAANKTGSILSARVLQNGITEAAAQYQHSPSTPTSPTSPDGNHYSSTSVASTSSNHMNYTNLCDTPPETGSPVKSRYPNGSLVETLRRESMFIFA